MSTMNSMFEDRTLEVEKYYGKYAGLRLDPLGEGAAPEPDGAALRGEILVQVPGILEEDPQGEENVQRPFQAWAKPCFPPGFFIIPQIGAQVWVEFVAGDINFPIWSGAWYPDEAAPHTVADQSPTEHQKIIRTTGNHLLQLDDTDGEEKIVITHKGGAIVQIDKDGSVLVTNQTGSFIFLDAKEGNATFMEQHGHVMTMTADGIALINKEGSALQMVGATVSVQAENILLPGKVIGLGDKATEPTILGNTFAIMYNAHTHPTPMGPSGPPVPTGPPLGPAPAGQGLTMAVVVK